MILELKRIDYYCSKLCVSDKTIPPEIKDIHYFTGNAKYYVPVIGDEPGTIKRWALKKQHHIFLKYKNKDSAFDHLYL